MKKATVRWWGGGLGLLSWVAHHECGWIEGRAYWHSAFWAADHHMRYDCGRREPSSGDMTAVQAVMTGRQAAELRRRQDLAPVVDLTVSGMPWVLALSTEECERRLRTASELNVGLNEVAEMFDNPPPGPAYTVLNEGGVQEDPTPTPDEDPTVELGVVTDGDIVLNIEGRVQSGGRSRGHRGWRWGTGHVG